MLKSFLLFQLLSLCLLYQLACCQETFNINPPSRLKNNYVVMKGTSEHNPQQDNLEKEYLLIRAFSNSKKKAYSQLNSQFRKIAHYLKTVNNIPDESSLISSKIEARFLNRRKTWLFQRIFVIYGRPQEVMTYTNFLLSKGVSRLQAIPAIQFLDYKIKALQAFDNAKFQMEKVLEKFPGFKILQADNLEIKDNDYSKTEQIIESQIQDEFNQQSQSDSQSQDNENSERQNFSYCRKDLHEELDCCPSDPWTIIKYYLGKFIEQQNLETTVYVRFKIGTQEQQEQQQQQQDEINQFFEGQMQDEQQQFIRQQ